MEKKKREVCPIQIHRMLEKVKKGRKLFLFDDSTCEKIARVLKIPHKIVEKCLREYQPYVRVENLDDSQLKLANAQHESLPLSINDSPSGSSPLPNNSWPSVKDLMQSIDEGAPNGIDQESSATKSDSDDVDETIQNLRKKYNITPPLSPDPIKLKKPLCKNAADSKLSNQPNDTVSFQHSQEENIRKKHRQNSKNKLKKSKNVPGTS